MGTHVLQQPVGTHGLLQSFLQKFGEGTHSDQRQKILGKIVFLREKERDCMNDEERAFFKLALKYAIQGLRALNDEEEDKHGDTTAGSRGPDDDIENGLY